MSESAPGDARCRVDKDGYRLVVLQTNMMRRVSVVASTAVGGAAVAAFAYSREPAVREDELPRAWDASAVEALWRARHIRGAEIIQICGFPTLGRRRRATRPREANTVLVTERRPCTAALRLAECARHLGPLAVATALDLAASRELTADTQRARAVELFSHAHSASRVCARWRPRERERERVGDPHALGVSRLCSMAPSREREREREKEIAHTGARP